MITNFAVRHYRCLEEVNVPLKPLTVLVGQNDSGKSAFVDALLTALSGLSVSKEDRWQLTGRPMFVTDVEEGKGRYTSVFRDGGSGWDRFDHVETMRPAALFRLPSAGIVTISAGAPEPLGQSPQLLNQTGQNLATILDYLLRQSRKRWDDILSAMSDQIHGLVNIRIGTPEASQREIEFEYENGLILPASKASTGVRIILFFITLVHLELPPKLVLVEEPETGVHPKRLEDIVSLLRDLTEGKYGKHKTQVVLTTHSPYLVDQVNLERDQVLVFQIGPDGKRTAQPADRERLGNFLDEFMLGEVWFERGESGLVKKPDAGRQ